MKCEMIPLDRLAETRGLPAPNFIKCDVEGAELNVFQGAIKLLNRINAPVIMFEANVHTAKGFGRSISASRDFLAGLSEPGYHFFTSEDQKLVKVEEWNPVHGNVIAVPCALLGLVKDR